MRTHIVERLLGLLIAADHEQVNALILAEGVTPDELEAAISLKRGLADAETERRDLIAALVESTRIVGPPIPGSPWTRTRLIVLNFLADAAHRLEAQQPNDDQETTP